MKRILAMVLAGAMMFAFAGCAKGEEKKEDSTTTTKGGLQIEYGDVVLSDDEA
jgi:hypothetical protein